MSTKTFSLQESLKTIPDASQMRFGIVVSEWNDNITGKLLEGAINTLKEHGAEEANITVRYVPGSFELIYGSSLMAESGFVDAVIAIGCVIRGDTPHFDYICQGVTQGLSQLNACGDTPVIFGLITVNSLTQAEDRAGGQFGNKGNEFALTAIKMAEMSLKFKK